MAQTMLVGDVLHLVVEGRNDQGQRARMPDGAAPAWKAEPPGLLILDVDRGGMFADVKAVSAGDVTLTVTVGELAPVDYTIAILPGIATRLEVIRS